MYVICDKHAPILPSVLAGPDHPAGGPFVRNHLSMPVGLSATCMIRYAVTAVS